MWDIFKDWIFYVIQFFDSLVSDWGLAIIVVTIIFRLLVWPLMAKQARSNYQMQKIQPEISRIQERFADDKVRMNPLVKFDNEIGWLLEGMTPGVSALGVTIVQERTDKKPDAVNCRLSQLTDLVDFEEPDADAMQLEGSELLERKVFKKVSGAKVMLHKFLLWKTNKEKSGRYPAYIIFHTDFSSGRKEMIKRDMLYTSDEKQAHELLAAEIADNVKKGWEEV